MTVKKNHMCRLLFGAACCMATAFLNGCSQIVATTITPSSTVEVRASISNEPFMTSTPFPACGTSPNVNLKVSPVSETNARVEVTGLQPTEPVYVLFTSEVDGTIREVGCCEAQAADAHGAFALELNLRSKTLEAEFTHWQVRVFHSGQAVCSELDLP